MKCLNCQKEYTNGEQFCSICGKPLVESGPSAFNGVFNNNDLMGNNQMNMNNSMNNSMNTEMNNLNFRPNFMEPNYTFSNSSNPNSMNSVNNDERWLRAYIGKNYEKIRNKKWSWPAFFFPVPYLLYRKYWKLAGIVLISILVINFVLSAIHLDILTFFTNNAVGIYFALNFNAMYMDYVKKDVEQIIKNNSYLSNEELEKVISQKDKPAKPSSKARDTLDNNKIVEIKGKNDDNSKSRSTILIKDTFNFNNTYNSAYNEAEYLTRLSC